MPQAKKKQSTKTAQKKMACKGCKKCCAKNTTMPHEKFHVFMVTVLGMMTAILLCAYVTIVTFC